MSEYHFDVIRVPLWTNILPNETRKLEGKENYNVGVPI